MTTPARFITALFVAIGIFFAGYLANRQKDPVTASASHEQSVTYACPMHPQYRSDRAGDCPMCGMRLERAAAGEAGNKLNPLTPDASGMVRISAERQQLIGVRTDEVSLGSSSNVLRVPGRIAVDDQRLYRIVAAADGWIVDLGENTVGCFVKKNQLLASYYQKDLLYTERLFLLSIPSTEPLPTQTKDFSQASIRTSGSANPQFPIDSLRGLGMSDLQIEEIHRTGVASPKVNIYSPVSGFVLTRNISPNQRFDKGTEMYRIADIGHVWVVTDILEKDREFVKPGAIATVRYQGREFKAHLSDALPQLDPQTRTLKTRFEVDNPGNILLPDAFVDVEMPLKTDAAITVPAEVVIDSGRRKSVYVQSGDGVFEPRLVQIGWRRGDRVQITQGLEPGDRVVTSGNFLIDSETRMRLVAYDNSSAAASEKRKAKDPVCGMDVDPDSPDTLKIEWDGQTDYFCAAACKTKFLANPAKYISMKAADEPKRVKDLVCGMEVDPKSSSTLKIQYKGETYYFCNEMCKKSFEANPGKYIQKTSAMQAKPVKDPVCGMDVDPKSAPALKSEYKGQHYHFCSEHCKKSFDASPEKYVRKGMATPDMSTARIAR
jgi:membrane fusion protein, copper/silver efflux system